MTAHRHLEFYIGTYTDSPSSSTGISSISLNTSTGEIHRLDDLIALRNPSYLTATAKGIYTFSEISKEEGASLTFIASDGNHQLPIEGDYPCHIDICPPYLAVANYGTGNVNAYLVDDTGKPTSLIADLFVDGSGPNKKRQESPHAHQVTFLKHSQQLAVVDLGADCIHLYGFQNNSGSENTFTLQQSIQMPAGSGPRHLVFNRDETLAYVVCELSEALVVLAKKQTSIWEFSYQCDLLTDEAKDEAAAAIRLSSDERFLYVSCRAQNKISLFDLTSEIPKLCNAYDCGGLFPRDFNLSADGHWLIVANQHSNNIVSFHRNIDTGELTPSGYQYSIGAPICLVEIQPNSQRI